MLTTLCRRRRRLACCEPSMISARSGSTCLDTQVAVAPFWMAHIGHIYMRHPRWLIRLQHVPN
eukprot:jgi/Botrbrau1/20015/Bobra.200_1s0021.1